MTKTQKAIQWMKETAEDNKHGYDQTHRWGERGDYDCSSAVITAWELAGVPVKQRGATYTGNMYSVFISCGFVDVTKSVNLATGAGLKAGDVLLNTASHTEQMISPTQCAGASINEHGRTTGGQPGDQTGKEFRVRNYYNYPWTHVLRYNEETHNPEETGAKTPAADNVCSAKIRTVRFGSQGPHVAAVQAALAFHGFDPVYIDGTAGQLTIAKLTAFQKDKGLQADGIAGPQTYAALY